MPTKTPLRPKHIPRRTCVGCGTIAPKRTLIRIVRTPEGEIVPDPTGKKSGRGAYLCANPQCWEQGIKKGRLERSLRTSLSPQDVDRLHSFIASLGLSAEEAT